uniref:Uncharacterized protein n=1 Tax=Panagrolaimus sp. ES5 TaxID=591445 RepID=A0AC34GRS3_9BILA
MLFRFIIFLSIFALTSSYVFKCLNGCECDTDDETIHCHNNRDRQRMELPEKRLKGYNYIGMTHNDIRVLPSEDLLLEKFPDLQAIDVELNPNFDCSTLPQYNKVQVLSDCGKDASDLTTEVYEVKPPTEDCDNECQLKRHYDSLHAYVLKLWEILKEKFEHLNKTKLVTDVRNWINELIENIKNKTKSENSDN